MTAKSFSLRLVRSRLNADLPIQHALFSAWSSRTLVFVNVDSVVSSDLQWALTTCVASAIIDMRAVPHFRFDGLSRRRVLETIQRRKLQHLELGYRLGLKRNDVRYGSGEVTQHIVDLLTENGVRTGPLLLLFDDEGTRQSALEIIPRGLELSGNKDWSVSSSIRC